MTFSFAGPFTTICPVCGSEIGDQNLHRRWHRMSVRRWARAVERRKREGEARAATVKAITDALGGPE